MLSHLVFYVHSGVVFKHKCLEVVLQNWCLAAQEPTGASRRCCWHGRQLRGEPRGRANTGGRACVHWSLWIFSCFWVFPTISSATDVIRTQKATFVLYPLDFSRSSLLMMWTLSPRVPPGPKHTQWLLTPRSRLPRRNPRWAALLVWQTTVVIIWQPKASGWIVFILKTFLDEEPASLCSLVILIRLFYLQNQDAC